MSNFIKYSLMILPFILGLLVYDLAIKLKISYNQSLPSKMLCHKGIAYSQIEGDGTVYLKTKQECINESMKGNEHDTTEARKSNQR